MRAQNARTGEFTRYGVAILGNSGTGKTTNVGHTHFLDAPGEQSLVVQDDFVGLRLADGRVLGTEQALFLKTDLDADDVLLRPAVESPAFVSQNLYVDHLGEILYLEEDLCANGRGILPIKALPRDRRHDSIDLPPLDELDSLCIIFNTRRNTVCPILQELTPEQSAAYFMLGESIETAAGDPAKAGQSVREVGTNPFIVGCDPAAEGNIFYDYLKRYEGKVRSFLLNTGGVGEVPDPQNPLSPNRAPQFRRRTDYWQVPSLRRCSLFRKLSDRAGWWIEKGRSLIPIPWNNPHKDLQALCQIMPRWAWGN